MPNASHVEVCGICHSIVCSHGVFIGLLHKRCEDLNARLADAIKERDQALAGWKGAHAVTCSRRTNGDS